ncbi:MAG: LysM peptidoglycan-binding domain-containing M23 family metallopeptidase [Candidatus Omnitrophica bacterium]|nr:LysM peptidoglycan-binding domain-containing M23 family metallopeptidase [Candidatus Omnitrophota bacterium]
MFNKKHLVYFLLLIAGSCYIIGCASAPTAYTHKPPITIPGVYHRVEKGQTLWRISQMYGVDLDEIVKINRVSDAANIETGQLIFIPHRQKPQYSTAKPDSNKDFIWPIRGRVITAFGQSSNNMVNKGINIQPYDNPDVKASRSGKIVFYTDNFKNFGKTIIIDHGDGFSTVYARNAKVFVRIGDYVQKGTIIAKAGSSGRDKNRYLHFEIRKGYASQNPYFYLSR